MKPGPPPKPTHLRLLEGNPGRRPMNTFEPQPKPRVKTPPAPKYLGEIGKAEWRRVAKELVALRLLTTLDMTALGIYCASFETWLEAEEALDRWGMVYVAPSRILKQSPWVGIARDAKASVRVFANEFGMSPAARTRVQVEREPAELEEIEEFLFGTGRLSPRGTGA